MSKIELSVVVPIYQEQEIIEEFYRELTRVLRDVGRSYEIIFVDDQSDTETMEVLHRIRSEDSCVKVLSLSRNFGHQVALTAGVDNASGDAVISMDGDLQHPPSLLPKLVEKWQEGYDVVYTIRQHIEGTGVIRETLSKAFYALMMRLSNVNMDRNVADFRLLSRKAVEGFKDIRESARFIRGLVGWMGYRKIGVVYVAAERSKGRSKYSPRKLISFAVDGVCSFSVIPIRLIGLIGFIMSCISFVYILRVVYYVLFSGEALPEYLPLLTVILFVVCVLIFMLGIVGEYVSKIFTESKNRPLYLIDEKYGFETRKD